MGGEGGTLGGGGGHGSDPSPVLPILPSRSPPRRYSLCLPVPPPPPLQLEERPSSLKPPPQTCPVPSPPPQLGELPSSLKPRLGDSNKNLTVQALGLLAKLARCVWGGGEGACERRRLKGEENKGGLSRLV